MFDSAPEEPAAARAEKYSWIPILWGVAVLDAVPFDTLVLKNVVFGAAVFSIELMDVCDWGTILSQVPANVRGGAKATGTSAACLRARRHGQTGERC